MIKKVLLFIVTLFCFISAKNSEEICVDLKEQLCIGSIKEERSVNINEKNVFVVSSITNNVLMLDLLNSNIFRINDKNRVYSVSGKKQYQKLLSEGAFLSRLSKKNLVTISENRSNESNKDLELVRAFYLPEFHVKLVISYKKSDLAKTYLHSAFEYHLIDIPESEFIFAIHENLYPVSIELRSGSDMIYCYKLVSAAVSKNRCHKSIEGYTKVPFQN